MFTDLIFPLYYRSIFIGLLFGLTYFFLVNPIKYKSNTNYLRFIGYNLLFILFVLLLIYFLFPSSFQFVAYISSLNTNSLFALITFSTCIIASLILFGFFKLPNFTDKITKFYPRLSPIAFLFDINLYLFLLNAYMISAYSVDSLYWLLGVILGFIMALSLSNLRYYFIGQI